MNRSAKVVIGLALAGAATVALVFAFLEGRAEMEREREREKPIRVPSRVARALDGSIEVHFDRDAQARTNLEVAALAAASFVEEVEAYGELTPDPLDAFVVRSPFAGRLRAAEAHAWPALGHRIDPDARVAEIEPRIGPVELLDLSLRRSAIERELASLRAELESSQAALVASRAALLRVTELNRLDKNASDRSVQEAEAKARADEARAHGAEAAIAVLEASLRSNPGPIGPIPVPLDKGGTVLQVSARPGETVEAGQSLFEVSSFERWIATVGLPLGATFDETAPRARIRVENAGERFFDAELIGDAPAVDTRLRGRTLQFAVRAGGAPLRTGTVVTAYLATAAKPVDGVLLPRGSVIRHAGRSWVYVEIRDATFVRREVTL